MANILDLFGDDPAVAQAQAKALADAMQQRRAAGTVATIIGGPFAAAGKAFSGDADQSQGLLQGAGQYQAGARLKRAGMAQEQAQHQAQLAAQATAQAEAARHNVASEGLARSAQEQDAWRFGQDATGGGALYNSKTGEVVPISPNGSFPGRGAGLKPQQFEADVQSLGKDMEPIAKVQQDMATLKAAAAKGDVSGFGPAAGYVPNALASNEGVSNRQAASRIMAGIIQMTSGQAASEKEVDRLLEANGLGRNATDAQIQEGVAKLDSQYQNLIRQRTSKYHPSVVSTYAQRGGFVGQGSEPAPQAAQNPAAGAGKVRRFNPATGKLE